MKWNVWILVCGVSATALFCGCGGKEQPQVASSAPPPASSPAAPASGSASSPISNEDSGSSTPAQPPTSKPSRPSIGGMGPPGANATVPPGAQSPPSRPSLGSSTGAPTSPPTSPPGGPSRPGLGSTAGAPAAPPPGSLAPGSLVGTTDTGATGQGSFASATLPAIELSLRDRAVNAFKAGNAPRAYGLFQAHALSVPSDEVESLMENFRWDKKRIVPRFGYSFAVGLVVKKSGKVDDLKPVGTSLDGLRGSAAGGGGRPGGGPGFGGSSGRPGGGASNDTVTVLPAKELSDAAGKFASKFVDAFSRVHSDGKWSEAFREYELGSSNSAPTGLGGAASGLAGALGGFGGATPGAGRPGGPPPGYGGGQGGPPAGYGGGQGGPPAGYGGGQGGPPAGYGGGQGGPPAGYAGGSGGPPPGYGGGTGGPPAGYSGGSGAGAPPGYGPSQGGPPAGYSGGSNSGAPPGYGGGGSAPSGAPPSGGQPPAGQDTAGNNGSSSPSKVEYVAPQDDALTPGVPGGATSLGAGARPGFGAPGAQPPTNATGSGFGNALAAGLSPAMQKELQLPSGVIPLAPGLNYIGSGENVGELSKQAVDGHYDALIVFEVEVSRVLVNNTVKNDCRIRAINLRADKESKDKAITSSSLNNRDVASDKDPDGKIDNAVDIFLKKMFEAYPLDDLPKLTSESIQKKRLNDLTSDKKRGPLDLLTEIELYASKGLIDEATKVEAFEKIAGPDGRVLATGTPEDKIPIVEKMVARRFD